MIFSVFFTGAKLAKTGSGGTQYYAEAMVYDETNLSYLLHDEGMVRIGHSGEARSYTYFYHLKDPLGNTRVEFQANPDNSYQVTQRQSYYPSNRLTVCSVSNILR